MTDTCYPAIPGPRGLKLSHVRLLVKDYRACLKFYRDVMGFEVGWGDEEPHYISFRTGASQIAPYPRMDMAATVGESAKPFEASHQPSQCLIIVVDDGDEVYATVTPKEFSF